MSSTSLSTKGLIVKQLIDQKEKRSLFFVINNVLSEKQNSNVYVVDSFSRENVVLKEIKDCSNDIDSHILRQLNILHFVKHSNIIDIYDIGITDNISYIYTSELTIGSLQSQFEIFMKLNMKLRLELFLGLTAAVKYLHCNNIAHLHLSWKSIYLSHNIKTDKFKLKLNNFKHSTFTLNSNKVKIKCELSSPEYLLDRLINSNKKLEKNYYINIDCWQLGLLFYKLMTGLRLVKNNIKHKILIDKHRDDVNIINKYSKTLQFDILIQLYNKGLLDMHGRNKFSSLLQDTQYMNDNILYYDRDTLNENIYNNSNSENIYKSIYKNIGSENIGSENMEPLYKLDDIFQSMLVSIPSERYTANDIYNMVKYIIRNIPDPLEINIRNLNRLYNDYCEDDVNDYNNNSIKRSFISDSIGFPNSYRKYNGCYNKENRLLCIEQMKTMFNKLNLTMEMLICAIDLLDRVLSKILIIEKELKLYTVICCNLAMKLHCEEEIFISEWYKFIKDDYDMKKFTSVQTDVIFEMKFDLYRHPVYLLCPDRTVSEWYYSIVDNMLNHIRI